MKALRHEAPAPEVLRDRLQRQAQLAERPVAVIFASAYRKHLGKVLLLRALEPLHAGHALGGRPPGQLTPADPRDSHHLDEVPEGLIVSAVKADHLAAGRLATASDLHATPDWQNPQPAIMHRLLAPTSERDSVKLSGALALIAEGDAALTVTQDPATGGALVGLQGPLAPSRPAPAPQGGLRHGGRGGRARARPTARRSPSRRRPPTATRSRPAAPASSPTSS